MNIYLDTNVFYLAYCPIEDCDVADWILTQLTSEFQGVTSEWTLIELFRALKKQVNLGKILEKDAKLTIDFFLTEIGEMSQKQTIQLVPITRQAIMTSRRQIFQKNLYVADALHAVIAIIMNVKAFITFDGDFKGDLNTVRLLNPSEKSFKNTLLELKKIPHL